MVGNNRLKIMKQFCGDTARCRLQPTLYTKAQLFALKKLIAAHQSQLQKFLKILNHPTWLHTWPRQVVLTVPSPFTQLLPRAMQLSARSGRCTWEKRTWVSWLSKGYGALVTPLRHLQFSQRIYLACKSLVACSFHSERRKSSRTSGERAQDNRRIHLHDKTHGF